MATVSIPSWLNDLIVTDNTTFPIRVKPFTNDTYKVPSSDSYGVSGGIGNTFGVAVGSTSFSIGDLYYCSKDQSIFLIVNINPSLEPYEIEEWVLDDTGLAEYRDIEAYKINDLTTINIISRLYLISVITATQDKGILHNTIIDLYNRFVYLRNEFLTVPDDFNLYKEFENEPLTNLSKDIFNTTSNALFIDNIPNTTSSLETFYSSGSAILQQFETAYPELRQSINIVYTLLQSLYKNQSYVSSKVLQKVVDQAIYPISEDSYLSHLIDYEVSSYTALGHVIGYEMLVLEMLETPSIDRVTVFDGLYSVSHDELLKDLMYSDGLITADQLSTDLSALYTALVSEGLFAGFNADIQVIHSLKQTYTVMTIYDNLVLE